MNRNPRLKRYTEIKPCDGEFALWLKVGAQSFRITDVTLSKKHAEWMQDMLCHALARMIAETKDLVPDIGDYYDGYRQGIRDGEAIKEALK